MNKIRADETDCVGYIQHTNQSFYAIIYTHRGNSFHLICVSSSHRFSSAIRGVGSCFNTYESLVLKFCAHTLSSRKKNMDRWFGKVAVVTGASSGIGAAITIDLVKAGLIVVGLARRIERVEQLREVIPSTATGKLFAIRCDVTQETDIKNSFAWVNEKFGGVDLLVNNAGIIKTINLVDENNTDALRETLDTNILAVALCTREAFQSMKQRGVDGHIIIMNSLTGHIVPYFVGLYPSFNIYAATKHAVTAMTEVLRQEFQSFNTRIKITVSCRFEFMKTIRIV